uniref:Connector enhancer of kinase suppressor of ras 2 n=1 Tax=Panagrolaimus sp. PS1159 TaxID=55785 RepID=A0AC35G9W0_9BILA
MSQMPIYPQKTADKFDITASFNCQGWHEQQVLEWFRGIDDSVLPYLPAFRKAKITGRELLVIDDAQLYQIGIRSAFAREKILSAVNLIAYYSYDVRDENLQKLAMLISIDISTLSDAILKASPVIDRFNNGSDQLGGTKLTKVLNSVLMSFSLVYEHVKRLVFWLDRAPFENQKEYVQIRDRVTELIMEMLDAVNPQNRRFMPVSEVLQDRGLKLQEICQHLLFSSDPSILYTSYFQLVYIRNTELKPTCGINFQSVFNGVNLITSIDPDSPAAKCKKLSAGDEIIEINEETVVGWSYENVKERLKKACCINDQKASDPKLLVNRRPVDDTTSSTLSKSKTSETLIAGDDEENRHKLELDFTLKIQPDMFCSREGSRRSLHRRRSSSFSLTNATNRNDPDRLSMPVLKPSALIASRIIENDKRLLYRRASVWSDSPPASFVAANRKIQNGLESKALTHLLDCWTEPKARPNGHLRLVRASRIAKATTTKLNEHDIVDEDEEIGDEPKVEDYSKVEIVMPVEAEKLKLALPSILDADWNAPVQEITGLRLFINKRIHLESTSSVAPDSPLSAAFNKITKFWQTDTGSVSAISTSYTSDKGDMSMPSTPVSKNALEKIAKEKSRQMPILSVQNGSHSRATTESPEPISSGLSSPRYCTAKAKNHLAPLAEPEFDDEEGTAGFAPHEEISDNGDMNIDKLSSVGLQNYVRIPCHQLTEKTFESWVRRQRIESDPTYPKQKKPSQWVKSWIVLVNDRVLLSYSNQLARSADLALDIVKCSFNTQPTDIKTTKKFVFCLSSGRMWYHFAPYHQEEYIKWVTKLSPNVHIIESSPSSNSPPETIVNGSQPSSSDDFTDLPTPSSPSASNTLPRTVFNPSKFILRTTTRKGSVTGYSKSTPAEIFSSAAGSIEDIKIGAKTYR